MKPTKEEVSLCKQVAEKHRKKIEYGDWYSDPMRKEGYQVRLCEYQGKQNFGKIYSGFIPLWTISDCLEFLSKQMYTFERAIQLGSIFDISFISVEGKIKKGSGDTMLEACLKAVLAVLEDSNG